MTSRTHKRSRSGAHIPCPECGKRVRTEKGLGMHIADVHFDPDARAQSAIEGTAADAGHPYGLEHPEPS